MKGLIRYLTVVLCAFGWCGVSFAQQPHQGSLGGIPIFTGEEGSPPDWAVECLDPKNTTPYSANYVLAYVGNELMFCSMGGGGTYTFGGGSNGQNGTYLSPCFSPPNSGSQAVSSAGKFAFSYGLYLGGTPNTTQLIPPAGVGSVQQYSPGFHNANMAIDFGAPATPGYCYANFDVDQSPTPSFFGGQTSATLFYTGESNRYMTYITAGVGGSFTIDLQVELVADAVRFRWTCTNDTTASHNIALWFCSGINMLNDQNASYWNATTNSYVQGNFGQPFIWTANNGASEGWGPDAAGGPPFFNYEPNSALGNEIAGGGGDPNARLFREELPTTVFAGTNGAVTPTGYNGIFVYLPNQRPPTQDTDLVQATDPADFPAYADFLFGESDPFGIRIETEPSASTNDINTTNLPSKATELVLGKSYYIIGTLNTTTMTPTVLIPDSGFLYQPAFVIKYQGQNVGPGATYQFLNYVRSNWGNGSYSLPFGAVVDAPIVVQEGATNYDGSSTGQFSPNTVAGGGLIDNLTAAQAGFPNAMLIRVWIDNVGGNVTSGYGVKNKEFTLDDVQVNLSFGAPGMTIENVGGATQTISSIAPRADAHVDFYVAVAQNVVGNVPYTVTINTVPKNTKVITGTINVSGRPQYTLYPSSNASPNANLVTAPYEFTDSSWQSILSNFTDPTWANVGSGATIHTYAWDPDRQGYVLSLQAVRGGAVWVVYSNPSGKPVFAPMVGATMPTGFDNATQQIELKPGWNLIANPYDLEFPINQLNGVAAASPDQVYTYQELVNQNFLSGYVATWNPVTKTYTYVSGSTGNFEPNQGYWIDDLLSSDITITYPPLFTEGAVGSYTRAPSAPLAPGLFRVNLVASEGAASDTATVGNAASAADVIGNRIFKAPASPAQTLELAMFGDIGGKTLSLQQALLQKTTSYGWFGYVNVANAGQIQLKWNNLASIPSTYRAMLYDEVSGETIDMRAYPYFDFNQVTPGLRYFKVMIVPNVYSTSLIASLNATKQAVGSSTVDKVSYTLSATSTTTVLVRNASTLQTVACLHSSRVDKPGANMDTWNLKNSSGQTVPNGKYLIQVTAATQTGLEQTAVLDVSVP